MMLPSKIGVVDVRGDHVRVAVIAANGGKPAILEASARRVVAVGDNPVDDEALSLAVRDAVAELSRKPLVWMGCADSQYVIARNLTIPFKGRSRVAEAVPAELEPYLAFPIEELVVDHGFVRQNGGETDVLTVGLHCEHLERLLNVLHAGGIEPEGIGLDAAGLVALWLRSRPGALGLHAVLFVQDNRSVLALIDGKTLVFFRTLAITVSDFQERPDWVARQTGNSLRAFLGVWRTEKPLEGLWVAGVPLYDDVRVMFEELIGLPAAAHDLTGTLVLPKPEKKAKHAARPGAVDDPRIQIMNPDFDSSHWHALAGVALGAVGAPVSFDFRRDAYALPNALKGILSHAVLTACLGLLCLAGYGGYCFADYRQNTQEITRIENQIWEAYSKAFPDSTNVKQGRPPQDPGGATTLAMLENDYKEYSKGSRGFDARLLVRPTLPDILNELALALPVDQVQISDLEVRPSTGPAQQVVIKGELRDASASLGQGIDKLRNSAILKVAGEPGTSNVQGKVTFTITATTGPSGS